MARILLAGLGVVMALFPDHVVDRYEQVAFKNPETAVDKPWLGSAIRAEGLLIALLSLAGGRGYAWLVTLMGLVGTVAVLFPTQYLNWGAKVAYQNPEEIEWVGWFQSVARGLGMCYVLQCLREYQRRRGAALSA